MNFAIYICVLASISATSHMIKIERDGEKGDEVCDYHVFTLVERGEMRQLCHTHIICQVCLFILSYKNRIERKKVTKQNSLQVWIEIQRVINAPT